MAVVPLVAIVAAAGALQPNLPLEQFGATSATMLAVGRDAAVAAGRHLLGRAGAADVVDTKLSSADLVTVTDRECQTIVEARIREAARSMLRELEARYDNKMFDK